MMDLFVFTQEHRIVTVVICLWVLIALYGTFMMGIVVADIKRLRQLGNGFHKQIYRDIRKILKDDFEVFDEEA